LGQNRAQVRDRGFDDHGNINEGKNTKTRWGGEVYIGPREEGKTGGGGGGGGGTVD